MNGIINIKAFDTEVFKRGKAVSFRYGSRDYPTIGLVKYITPLKLGIVSVGNRGEIVDHELNIGDVDSLDLQIELLEKSSNEGTML